MNTRFPVGSIRHAVFVAGDDWRLFREPTCSPSSCSKPRELGIGDSDRDRRLVNALAYLSSLEFSAEALHDLMAGDLSVGDCGLFVDFGKNRA